jgi:hypothetical protein
MYHDLASIALRTHIVAELRPVRAQWRCHEADVERLSYFTFATQEYWLYSQMRQALHHGVLASTKAVLMAWPS